MAKEAKNKLTDLRILILGEESQLVAMLAKHMVLDLNADVTIVDTLEEGRTLAATGEFDVVVSAPRRSADPENELLSPRSETMQTPVVLIADEENASRTVEAFRRGACDVITPPFEGQRLTDSVERAARMCRRQRRLVARNKRLRRVSTQLIRDRRDLRKRVDLVCRDLDSAYRKLAEKVVALDQQEPASEA